MSNAERITLHCFKCGARTEHERILLSSPVYRCLGGCGNTREIHELGRGQIQAPAPQPRPMIKREEKVMAEEEAPKFKRSPLQVAIQAAVTEETEGLRDQLKELTKTVSKLEDKEAPAGVTDKELEAKIDEYFEKQLPDLVQRTLLQMLSTPAGAGKKRSASGAEKSKCPRSPHKGRHGQACRDAGYQG